MLDTSRLILRLPSAHDFDVYEKFYADVVASTPYGGPLSSLQAWKKLASDIGHWHLKSFGMWSVLRKDTGEMVGGCGVVAPEGWPRSELTWWIIPSMRRQGFAREASKAVIKYFLSELKWDAVETHMNDENVAARNLALKLGGRLKFRSAFPDGLERDVFEFTRSPK